jgi:hypothetical protein
LTSTTLASIRAVSATNIWAVGSFSDGAVLEALILHWDGHSWAQFENPDPGSAANDLSGVRAVSASDAWAVGNFSDSGGEKNLILHWNGREWLRVASPDQGGRGNDNFLSGVTATSDRNAWAVGAAASGLVNKTLILRWNGTRWVHVASPNPGSSNDLIGVAASSSGNAWAVGTFDGVIGQALAIHCC